MGKSGEFYTFDEVIKYLQIPETKLKRLVSEGEIRAFREGDTMKLRRSDVENLRSELSGGEVVDLGGAGEELVFEDDTDLDAGMATEEISEADTLLEEVEEVEEVAELESAPAGLRRPSPVPAASDEPAEAMWVRAVAILTAVVLLMGLPIAVSVATGNVMGMARSIAGMFGIEL